MNQSPLDTVIENIAKDIFDVLGSGHRENVYHKAFEIELRNMGVPYECEVVVPIFYKDQFLSHMRLDLVVAKRVIVELKAIRSLKDEDVQQLKRYMKTTCKHTGYLINFGFGNECEIVRVPLDS